MTTDQKLRFIEDYIESAVEAEYKEVKKYFLCVARGATLAYGADGTISTSSLTELINRIDGLLKEV